MYWRIRKLWGTALKLSGHKLISVGTLYFLSHNYNIIGKTNENKEWGNEK